jgi:hypothetical protein
MARKETQAEAQPGTAQPTKPQVQVQDWPQQPQPYWPQQPSQYYQTQYQQPQPAPAEQAIPSDAPAQQDQPAQMAAPPLLGSTPTGINQIIASLGTNKGTHFTGPVCSGGPPGKNIIGSALDALFLHVDYTMKNFSLPVQFPVDSILLWAAPVAYTAFVPAATATLALGSTLNGVDILAATPIGTGPVAVTGQLPVGGTTPFQAYVTVGANTLTTAGSIVVALIYATGFPKWS